MPLAIVTPHQADWEQHLRQLCTPVEQYGPPLQKLLREMIQRLPIWKGSGAALPQVGRAQRAFVYETETGRKDALINPELVDGSGTNLDWEGCLSIPGVRARVSRYTRVNFRGLNLQGNPMEVAAQGHTARLLQHELDHLDGVLFVDRCDLDSLEIDGYRSSPRAQTAGVLAALALSSLATV